MSGSRVHRRQFVGFVAAVAASLAALSALGVAAAGADQGPPPWAPGPGGPDVVHAMHGNPARPGGGGGSTSPLLTYRGGAVQASPAVYLVFWGSQWTNNDPAGMAPVVQSFLSGLYGTKDTWSTSTTQYCQNVKVGSTNCDLASAADRISHPGTTPPLLGVLSDNSVTAPTHPKQRDLAGEAVRAAGIFKTQQGGKFNPGAQFVIATAHNNNATGFGSSYCAWHSSTSSVYGNLAYTNLPYIPDAGGACGASFVNPNGALDGVTIVEGHEYAETVTDPFPNSGWLDGNGAENGDKCAWISSGQGKAANVPTSSGTYPVQSLWSNNFNGGGGGCVITYTSPTNQG